MYAGIVFAVTRKTATYKPTNESAYIHGTIRGDAVLSCEVDRRLFAKRGWSGVRWHISERYFYSNVRLQLNVIDGLEPPHIEFLLAEGANDRPPEYLLGRPQHAKSIERRRTQTPDLM